MSNAVTLIAKPELRERGGQLRYTTKIGGDYPAPELTYEVPVEYAAMVSARADAALTGLLIPAMVQGGEIRVEGAVSARLLHSLRGPYQKLLRTIIPRLKTVTIHADAETELARGTGVGSGFSGGVDSYCLVADHRPGSLLPLTHLIFNNVGSHGHGEAADALFLQRYDRLKPMTEELGLPFIAVHSNLDLFYVGQFNFQQTHTPRNVSAAMILQSGISTYLYASAYQYRDLFIGEADDIAYSDAFGLPMLSTEQLSCSSSGSEYTRVKKTLNITGVEETWRSLDVCVDPAKAAKGRVNCSQCWKCMRTLATLEVGGHLHKYEKAFDLARYQLLRKQYFAEALVSKDPLIVEIIDFAKSTGFDLPLYSRILGNRVALKSKYFAGRALRRLRLRRLGL